MTETMVTNYLTNRGLVPADYNVPEIASILIDFAEYDGVTVTALDEELVAATVATYRLDGRVA
jgi:hypothetical protein